MIWLGRLISIPVGLVFFVVLLVILVVLQVNDTFLDPDYYPEEMKKANIYEFVLVDLLMSVLDEAREQEPPEGMDENPLVSSGLSTQQVVSSVNRAIPPQWVQGLVEQSFDQFGRYLTGERDEFEVTVRAGEQVMIMKEELKDLLRDADAYNLLFEQVVDPAVEDAATSELPLSVKVSPDRLVEAVRSIVSPDWVQAQVEDVLDEVAPYIVGERDTFKIHVPLADRVEIALEEVKKLLHESDAYDLLYDEVVDRFVRDSLGDRVELPSGVAVGSEEVLSVLQEVAPIWWVERQAEMVIDETGSYLTGQADSFAVEISLKENKRLAQESIAKLVKKRLKEHADNLPICTSQSEERVALAKASRGLPLCIPSSVSTDQLLSWLDKDVSRAVQASVLDRIPDNIKYTEGRLRGALAQGGATENLDRLDEVRELLNEGWVYTQDDLRADLSEDGDEDAVERLDDVRAFLADGWTYTDADLREDLREQEGGTQVIEALDNTRTVFKLSRSLRWLAYVPMVMLLIVIGFLGGRNWSGRVAWAAAFLLIAAGIVFLVFGPGYESYAKAGPAYEAAGYSDFDDVREEVIDRVVQPEKYNSLADENAFPNTSRLLVNKVFEMGESVADEFAGGMATSSFNLAVIGLLALIGAIFWSIIMAMVHSIFPSRRSERGSWFR